MWGLGSICWGLRGGGGDGKVGGVLAGQRVGWTDHQGYSLLLCHVLSIEKSWWRPVLFTIQKKRSTSSKGEPSSPHDLACHSDPPAKKQRYKHFAHEHYHVSAAEHQAKRIARPSQSFASASFCCSSGDVYLAMKIYPWYRRTKSGKPMENIMLFRFLFITCCYFTISTDPQFSPEAIETKLRKASATACPLRCHGRS